jgi:hypothetical protein
MSSMAILTCVADILRRPMGQGAGRHTIAIEGSISKRKEASGARSCRACGAGTSDSAGQTTTRPEFPESPARRRSSGVDEAALRDPFANEDVLESLSTGQR